MRRVVVTGMGGVSPIGNGWQAMEAGLRALKNGVRYMPEWEIYEGLNCRIAAIVPELDLPAHYTRQRVRSMGRIGMMSTFSSEMALADAGLIDNPILTSGKVGIAYGSSSGSPASIQEFGTMLVDRKTDSIRANTYVRMMPHTTAVNIGIFFGIRGRIIPTSSACTSGSLAIGYAYEAIKHGQQVIMVAGGAEEISPSQAAVFETLYATSSMNEQPHLTPCPFEASRDGLVIGEGAATLVLEDLEHALARGAHIHAEIIGFATNSDGRHVTQPTQETMAICMDMAVQDAGVSPDTIGYVNAHGTATDLGDVAESQATRQIFGRAVPISSLKSYLGHTLGACGSLEAMMTIGMMNGGWFAPTLNLQSIDPRCAELDYIVGAGREIETDTVMTNNFAFGGVNTSLILKRFV
ncbi:beta-ketoacyl-ACP synthase [Pedomonas mirosovicensis]|uniref:beta-ketoacyl-ACP synthase n=1 Tax=Pedomonas mirosovicensis TaxID=2908641 RepID=UPI002168B206|nr:beta-ketoacyl-ACP synthase [Pedomonas mirosovicensis]MCH8686360.1 beta-ketoacyl-ACP synthase [Pedomonas mirosovicensis]